MRDALDASWPIERVLEPFFPSAVEVTALRSAMLACLAAPRGEARAEACRILGRLQPAVTDAIPLLLERLDDPTRKVRIAAAQALGVMENDTPPVRQALETLLDREGRDTDVGSAARTALRRLSERATMDDACSTGSA